MFTTQEYEKIKVFLTAMFGTDPSIDIDSIIDKLRIYGAISQTDTKQNIVGYIAVFCQFADAPAPEIATTEFRFNPVMTDSRGRNPGEYFRAGQHLLAE